MTKTSGNATPNYTWAIWALGLLAVGLGVSLVAGAHGLPQLASLETTLAERSATVHQKIALNARLGARLHGLQHDHAVIEREARTLLNLVRPDEVVFIFEPAAKP